MISSFHKQVICTCWRCSKKIRINYHQTHVIYPIKLTFNPLPAVVFPTESMSMVIIASSASEESDITLGVTAVVVVDSEASKVSLVDKIVVPDSFTSTVKRVAPVATVATEPLTSVKVKA